MTTFFCMRHGLTEWNREKKLQGQTDIDLCDEGRDMARQWAESLAANEFHFILTSPLKRAVETAEIINERLGLPVHTDERLIEQDLGKWTGLTKAEMLADKKAVRKQENRGFGFTPPGGESRDEVLMRACDALLEFSEDHEGKVLVITHKGVLKCLAYALSGMEYMPAESNPMQSYRIHRIECFDNELALSELNMEL